MSSPETEAKGRFGQIRRCFSVRPPSIYPVKTVERWSQIPEFEDEREEAAFWADHALDPRLMNAAIQRQTVRESTTITLRFDPQMLSRIKRLARHRYLNYQSMIKQWLSERLEEEVSKQNGRSSEQGRD
jgi:predicted DNA binding CopG/RHH family protein